MKVQKLCEMRQETETLEKHLERQSSELSEAQGDLDQLQSLLHTLNPEDLRHVSKIAASILSYLPLYFGLSIVFFHLQSLTL